MLRIPFKTPVVSWSVLVVGGAMVSCMGCTQSSTPAGTVGTRTSINPDADSSATAEVSAPAFHATESNASNGLPRLLDLGAGKCLPCKMMTPILDDLKERYQGKLDVEFIDVWKNPDVAKSYGVEVIPTQIFFDASGKEKFRHQGFFAKEAILAKWKELGVDLGETAAAAK